jgi:hypothetical protein
MSAQESNSQCGKPMDGDKPPVMSADRCAQVDEMFARIQTRVLANWYLPPRPVLENLGSDVTLDLRGDWQLLKQFAFGTLWWDYEEGLRFESDISKTPDLVSFVREYHTRWQVPFVQDATPTRRGWAAFSCYFAGFWAPGADDTAFVRACEAAGLTRSRRDRITWELRGSAEDPE